MARYPSRSLSRSAKKAPEKKAPAKKKSAPPPASRSTRSRSRSTSRGRASAKKATPKSAPEKKATPAAESSAQRQLAQFRKQTAKRSPTKTPTAAPARRSRSRTRGEVAKPSPSPPPRKTPTPTQKPAPSRAARQPRGQAAKQQWLVSAVKTVTQKWPRAVSQTVKAQYKRGNRCIQNNWRALLGLILVAALAYFIYAYQQQLKKQSEQVGGQIYQYVQWSGDVAQQQIERARQLFWEQYGRVQVGTSNLYTTIQKSYYGDGPESTIPPTPSTTEPPPVISKQHELEGEVPPPPRTPPPIHQHQTATVGDEEF